MTIINDNGVDRLMTPEEQAAHEAWAIIALQEQADAKETADAKAAARQSALEKLSALGFSDSEISALVG